MIDPIGDRHWAQRNLFAVSANMNRIVVPFIVANPLEKEEVFELKARQLDRRQLELLSLRMKGEPGEMALRMRLVDGLGKAVTEPSRESITRLALGPRRQRRYSLALDFEKTVHSPQIVAVELTLTYNADGARTVGSLGIVISGLVDDG
ncbi:hypothetical protein WQE_34681 [Paraburkholderia hospita]|uniref:Uncharacterized protein n=1 Tax=Paraburkholderia hospita TaxID=169430 RepID=A0ABN0FCF3_9BURK|nr:hypothetical protein WQE_34681 [Paraburkholderia hospita]OUL79997.1 hypothetical protein CA602_28365 [Paraburkholderia hospita]